MDRTIGFIGCGNLAEALIKGLITRGGVPASRIFASDRVGDRLLHVAETYEIKIFNRNHEVAEAADVIFIAVKPADVPAALAEAAPAIEEGSPGKLLISVAAGVTTGRVLEALRDGGLRRLVPVVRAMPNTPVTVGEGVTALTAGAGASAEEVEIARRLFFSVGKVVFVENESLMDLVTGLSGSGPAYFFLVLEAMVEAGVRGGLDEGDALVLAAQTALGAARLALEGDRSLKELREMVTSPGGTTVEGLKALNGRGVPEAFAEAVEAAARRSRELSGGG